MSDQTRHDKKVTVELDVPLVNVGRVDGGKYDGNKNQTVFEGRVEVTAEQAEDLLRRQKEWSQYEKNLIRDNGSTGVHIQDFS